MKLRSIAVAGAIAIAGITAGTAAPAASADSAPVRCVTVYDFPDAGLVYCYDLSGSCTLSETRTTFIGTETRCLVRRPV